MHRDWSAQTQRPWGGESPWPKADRCGQVEATRWKATTGIDHDRPQVEKKESKGAGDGAWSEPGHSAPVPARSGNPGPCSVSHRSGPRLSQ